MDFIGIGGVILIHLVFRLILRIILTATLVAGGVFETTTVELMRLTDTLNPRDILATHQGLEP